MTSRHSIDRRKLDHIRINLEENVSAKGITNGLERYRFEHQALPDVDYDRLDASLTFLGHRLRLPILISSMTGGVEEGGRINRNLAAAAQAHGAAMGLGSGRIALESVAAAAHFRVRDVAPDILLMANLGAVQLNYGYTARQCLELVRLLEADALILHLNALQEAVQPEGNTRFGGLIGRIAEVCAALPVPVIVKEVGWGFSTETVRALVGAGVAAVDVAGAGGTSWSEVERRRGNEFLAAVAEPFADWGIPTADSVIAARQVAPDLPLVASGGIRNGVEIAKCIALGADLVGLASPLLKAAARSAEDATQALDILGHQLRVAMFCVAAPDLAALRHTPYLHRIGER
ncbi:MAG TPA: type 2 isopentenyl-diphosphate Delta-isomerase [Chloroflexota bacterium]|nr:type 2 isopentenyl-diphosphate Delta-isomerase [Chloroflexota bacterium]